jgi:hypothetical protein
MVAMRLLVFLITVPLLLAASQGCENSVSSTPAATAAPWAPPATAPKGSGIVRIAVPPAGVLEVAPESVDFGLVAPASIHPATFVLANKGSVPITVASVTTSCACTTTSSIDGITIPPGGTLDLDAALVAPRQPETKTSKVFLRIQGVAQPILLKLTGDVTLPIKATPPFAAALKGTTSGIINLASMDGVPFRVLSSNGRNPVFLNFDPTTDAPRSTYSVAWSIASMSCETIPRWWVFETDRADCPLVPCRVRNECTGSRRDQDRFTRFWSFSDYLLDGGAVTAGVPFTLTVDLNHTNPRGGGAVVAPTWKNVLGAASQSSSATAILVSSTPVDGETVSITLQVVVEKGYSGLLYVPVSVKTETGVGVVDVVAKVKP